jgi:hypothetical protein
MQSDSSYMTKGNRGGNAFDDVTSQGSYLVRGGQSKFDDLQSQGSYMVRGAGNSKFDDTSSQGSYFVRGDGKKMEESVLEKVEEESEMVRGDDNESMMGFGGNALEDLDEVTSQYTTMNMNS